MQKTYCIIRPFVIWSVLLVSVNQARAADDYAQLPAANQRILRDLDSLGISGKWKIPEAWFKEGKTREQMEAIRSKYKPYRDHKNSFVNALTDQNDRLAFSEILQNPPKSRLEASKLSNWKLVDYSPKTFPTATLTLEKLSYQLMRLPEPTGLPALAYNYAGILPGDVAVFTGYSGKRVVAVWAGNRRFPHWERGNTFEPVSFFYYSYDSEIYNQWQGLSFNSYPPRITPLLYRRIVEGNVVSPAKSQESSLIAPNSKLFLGAGGYVSSSQHPHAYAHWYMAPEILRGDDWTKEDAKILILRRKDSKSLLGINEAKPVSDGVTNPEPVPLNEGDRKLLLKDLDLAITMMENAVRELGANGNSEIVREVLRKAGALDGKYSVSEVLDSYASLISAARTMRLELESASVKNGQIEYARLKKQISTMEARGGGAVAWARAGSLICVSQKQYLNFSSDDSKVFRAGTLIHELGHYELGLGHRPVGISTVFEFSAIPEADSLEEIALGLWPKT